MPLAQGSLRLGWFPDGTKASEMGRTSTGQESRVHVPELKYMVLRAIAISPKCQHEVGGLKDDGWIMGDDLSSNVQ